MIWMDANLSLIIDWLECFRTHSLFSFLVQGFFIFFLSFLFFIQGAVVGDCHLVKAPHGKNQTTSIVTTQQEEEGPNSNMSDNYYYLKTCCHLDCVIPTCDLQALGSKVSMCYVPCNSNHVSNYIWLNSYSHSSFNYMNAQFGI